jgi:hypothetical protein
MKVYKIIEYGRDIYRFISIPKKFIDYELEITIKPIRKKQGSIFSDFLKDKEKVPRYKNFPREELHAR